MTGESRSYKMVLWPQVSKLVFRCVACISLIRMIFTNCLWCSAKKPPMNSLQLYKYLLRQCDKLPKDAQKFYKHSIRQVRFYLCWSVAKSRYILSSLFQNYRQHVHESDTERVNVMITKTLEDAQWIINKVRIELSKLVL